MPQARITGHVVLADTQDPARNAVVLLTSLDGQNRQFQRVGLDGTYLFEHVVPGEYIIIPYLDGYLSPFDKLTLTPADTTIAALFEKIVVAQGSLKVGAQGTQTFNLVPAHRESRSGLPICLRCGSRWKRERTRSGSTSSFRSWVTK